MSLRREGKGAIPRLPRTNVSVIFDIQKVGVLFSAKCAFLGLISLLLTEYTQVVLFWHKGCALYNLVVHASDACSFLSVRSIDDEQECYC